MPQRLERAIAFAIDSKQPSVAETVFQFSCFSATASGHARHAAGAGPCYAGPARVAGAWNKEAATAGGQTAKALYDCPCAFTTAGAATALEMV
jgi:hypothetical protein